VRPEYQVTQYVAVVHGRFSDFMVFRTGSGRHYLFCQLFPGTLTMTGLQWPVEKSRLDRKIKMALARGRGN
jgi:hypothetical protein